MELISNYMRDDDLRHALNDLTQKTFCFNFEGWVTGGYFEGDYIPYSFIENGKILANVSANRMQFMQNGVVKNYIQLGTVMTDEAYRRQGLAGKLIKHVVETYEKDCDGIYLFGNLEALGFYRKMGFREGLQYSCSVKKEYLPDTATPGFSAVDPEDRSMKEKYMDAVRNSAVNSSFEQINKFGLQLFYTSSLEGIFYERNQQQRGNLHPRHVFRQLGIYSHVPLVANPHHSGPWLMPTRITHASPAALGAPVAVRIR